MRLFSFWMTLFSCMFGWCIAVTAECDVAHCYDGLSHGNFSTDRDNWNRFCGIVGSSAETTCLDRVSGGESCEREVQLKRHTYAMICSRSFQDVLDVERCQKQYMTLGEVLTPACNAPQTSSGSTPDHVCSYLTNYLTCVNDKITIACDRGRNVTGYYITFTTVLALRERLNEDCPLISILGEPNDVSGAGSYVIRSRLLWFVVAVVTILTTSCVR